MRLLPIHIQSIRQIVHGMLGDSATIMLFGSRLDDHACGGDVDLLIHVDHTLSNTAFTAALLAVQLERKLDGRRVDVILRTSASSHQAIDDVAKITGVAL